MSQDSSRWCYGVSRGSPFWATKNSRHQNIITNLTSIFTKDLLFDQLDETVINGERLKKPDMA